MPDYPNAFTSWVDGQTELAAAWFNAIEQFIGISGSADTNSLVYKLVNVGSVSPGHKHNVVDLANGDDGDILWKNPATHAWEHVTADVAGVVAKAGDQTVAGKKTFSTIPEGPASDPATDNQLTRRKFVTDQVAVLQGEIDAVPGLISAAITNLINTYHLTTTTTTTSSTTTTSTTEAPTTTTTV